MPVDEQPAARPGLAADMGLVEHLEELRRRLLRALLAWLAGFALCYHWAQELFVWFSAPVLQVLPPGSSMVFVQATEPFFTYLKAAALAGFLVALPILLYQLWAFVAPALYPGEKRFAVPFVLSGCLCFGAGTWFGFQLVFPLIFQFLIQFGTDSGQIQAMLSMGAYLSLASRLLLAFGLVFEMPILSFFLARLGLITGARLASWRRHAFVAAFIIGAMLTPPDVISQLALAVPFILLYEVSILVARLSSRRSAAASVEARD